MIGRLNHVGVATPSIEKSVTLYRDVLGATKIHDAFDMPEQGVRVCFVDVPNSQIELIEPLGDDSPVHGFLAKNFSLGSFYGARPVLEFGGPEVSPEERGCHR